MGGVTTNVMEETTDLLQRLIRNSCVNEGTAESGHEIRSVDLLESYLRAPGVEVAAALPGGDPFIVSAPLGRGRTVLKANYGLYRHNPGASIASPATSRSPTPSSLFHSRC